MRICFFDPLKWDYTVNTPFERPLGGTQSAACYLAVELVRLGHDVSLVNGVAKPGMYQGVRCVNSGSGLPLHFFKQHDVVVSMNFAGGLTLREQFGTQLPLVLWASHAHDQPGLRPLANSEQRDAWSAFTFISQWQRDKVTEQFALPAEKTSVITPAPAPAFQSVPVGAPWFSFGVPPVLVYTSTPFRGLDVLLAAFPAIRSAVSDVRLRVFSSMALYQFSPEQDRYAALYKKCSATEGVEYVGPLSQPELARETTGAAALAYPSTFAETYCLSAIEAMATGAAVITTRLGALPETTNGFGYMIEPRPDKVQLAEDYAALVIGTLDEMREDPYTACARRDAQVAYVRNECTWPARAKEWVAWLSNLPGRA